MELVNRIRDNQKSGMNIKTAVNVAVASCIEDGIMEEFLTKHKAEVMSVCLTEFDEKIFVDGIRKEGIEEGISQGRIAAYVEMLNDGMITLKEAAKRLNMSETDLNAYCENKNNREVDEYDR